MVERLSRTGTGSVLTRRNFLKLAGLGAAGGLVAGCTSGSSRPRVPIPADALNVRHFGALGDGTTDDMGAIAKALAALDPGQTLIFPQGTYRHSDVVQVTTHGVRLQGPGKLFATAEETSALRIDAPDVTVRDMTVAMGTTTQRWSSDDQHKIFLAPHSGISVVDVLIDGSAAAGLFSYGAEHFLFDRVQVRDTRADGIHMTYGSHDGSVREPRISRSGDDGVAVVSYLQDPDPCHHIEVISPHVEVTTGGRGVSVVGGHDVSYHDVHIDRSNAASVYIACETGDFVTHSTQRVQVTHGDITHANTNSAIDHGAVLVYSGRPGGTVSDVRIAGLSVSGTRSTASRQIGAVADSTDDAMSDVVFENLTLAATPTPYQGNAPDTDIRLDDVRAAGTLVRAGR